MRKHFLILMLMALLPLAGWAAPGDPVAPSAKTGLVYNGGDQELVTAGVAAAEHTYYYAVIAKGEDAPAFGDYVNDPATITRKAAGTYYVYSVVTADEGGVSVPPTAEQVAGLKPLTVTIAKRPVTVPIKANALAAPEFRQKYGFKPADFTVDYDEVTVGDQTVQGDFLTALVDIAHVEGLNLGGTEPTTDDLVVVPNWGNDVNVKGYYDAGEYDFSLSVNSLDNYSISLVPSTGKWYVDKANLTVSAQNTDVTYGAVFKGDEKVDYDGFVLGEDEDYVFAGQKLTWNTTYKDASNPTQVTPSPISGAIYSWQPSGLTAANYNITYNNGNITVVAKPLTDADVDISNFTAATYNKHNQKPTEVTGKYGSLDLVAADYDLSYLENITVNATTGVITGTGTDNLTNAGEYGVVITGKGNYSGVVYKTFTINKRHLGVLAKTLNHTYNNTDQYATAHTVASAVTFDGLQTDGTTPDAYPDDVLAAGSDPITLVVKKESQVVTKAIDAGTYTIEFGPKDGIKSDNYILDFNGGGKLTIAQRPITLTVKDKNKGYGDIDYFVEGVAASETDVELGASQLLTTVHEITAYPLLKRKSGEEMDTYDLYLEEGETTNKLVIKTTGASPVEVTSNYKPTFVRGHFTIGEGQAKFWAVQPDPQTYSKDLTLAAANAMLTVSITGMMDEDVAEIQNKVNGLVELDVTGLGLESTSILPANETGYSIKFKAIDVDKVFTPAMKAKYSSTILPYAAGTKFIVNKAPLKIEALTQSLRNSATIKAASSETVKISEETPLAQASDLKDLFHATTGIKLKFSDHVEKTDDITLKADANVHGWDGEVAKTNGIYVGGIVIDATAYVGNYTLTGEGAEAKAGLLTVTNADIVAFDVTDETTEQIEAQVNKLINAQISLDADKKLVLYGDEWTAMTLPFDIDPLAFCNAIGGYAIFDVLQKTGTAMNFKITYETIPAYTPFLVKVKNDVNMYEKHFDNVIVKAIEDAAVANDAYIFQGNLAKCTPEGWLITANSKGAGSITLWNNVGKPAAEKYDCKAFQAYIMRKPTTPSTEAPVLYIEEADGSTTAISAITADGVAVKAEGWYTIDGIRLQGAPTEKGIYINNGKKIVIK